MLTSCYGAASVYAASSLNAPVQPNVTTIYPQFLSSMSMSGLLCLCQDYLSCGCEAAEV